MATTTIVEHCQVAPCAATTELLLPLVFSDAVFLPHPLREILIFYTFPCSESHFFETIVPNLKNYLSLTLKHFVPLAGKITIPLTSSGMPVSHFEAGDSISLTIAVSDADLIPLTGDLSRDSDQFHHFVPDLPSATRSPEQIKFSVASVQVTLFPNEGISIGITHNHAIMDGSTLVRFLHAWASITKFGGDSRLLALGQQCLSFYDRGRLLEEGGSEMTLTAGCWDLVKTRAPMISSSANYCLPTGKTRATFVLSGADIQKLKNFVLKKKKQASSMGQNVSSFAVVCAHVWTCLVKSYGEEAAGDDEPEYLNLAADFKGRLDPPLPENYFGNCLAPVLVESTRGMLKGDRGIVIAAEATWDAIQKVLKNEGGILKGYLKWVGEIARVRKNENRVLGIGGSPRFDLYAADFGWGRAKKFEAVHIDYGGSISLCKSREFEGGVEIGLSMTKVDMDAFAAIFNQGLIEATKIIAYDDQLSKL